MATELKKYTDAYTTMTGLVYEPVIVKWISGWSRLVATGTMVWRLAKAKYMKLREVFATAPALNVGKIRAILARDIEDVTRTNETRRVITNESGQTVSYGRTRDHREKPPRVRDHRGKPRVRDHREKPPRVRDHREYKPGEERVISRPNTEIHRPHTWTVEYNGREGLDFDAYNTTIRSPYIQNVTQNRATVLWRVGIPGGWDLKRFMRYHTFFAEAKIGEGTSAREMNTYSTKEKGNAKISVSITKTYIYDKGVKHNNPMPHYPLSHQLYCTDNKNWLNCMSDRPVIQCKVVFKDLKPGTAYWYRIESEGVLDEDEKKFRKLVLAEKVYFRTAPSPSQKQKVSFLAMGDLGPGNSQPSYFYDVFDLFHRIARERSPDLWLALGDIDNDTDGHPNAMDPFFFNVYNAYHDKKNPRLTSHTKKAQKTNVEAFKNPPYCGLLGGLPVYPTFGNHDVCTNQDSSLNYLEKAYGGSFELPYSTGWGGPARIFNRSGRCKNTRCQVFYTFRYGDVIFISLGIPQEKCGLGSGEPSWKKKWGDIQKSALEKYLKDIETEIEKAHVWVVVYFHDHNYGLADERKYYEYRNIFSKGGVDLVLTAHSHIFKEKIVRDVVGGDRRDYSVVVVGTGGFGDAFRYGGSYCNRPGFILVEIKDKVLEYWKYETHNCRSQGRPVGGRGGVKPHIKQHRKIRKKGLGKHVVEIGEILNIPV